MNGSVHLFAPFLVLIAHGGGLLDADAEGTKAQFGS
jgi:hypothetical protein